MEIESVVLVFAERKVTDDADDTHLISVVVLDLVGHLSVRWW
jgi:hypothetical protein